MSLKRAVDSEEKILFLIVALVLDTVSIFIKAYLNFFCYDKILRHYFPQLPLLTVGEMYLLTIGVGFILYTFKPTPKRTYLEALDFSFQRFFTFSFAWLVAYVAVKVIL